MKELFKNIKYDLPASIVVFFVAVPLCLGIALASGAPLFAGIIAGIVGGIVVGSASGSSLGVSGPAAGLAVIVLTAIGDLGGWEIFLLAVVLSGIIQLVMGYARLGVIAHYFPTSVIKGMLTGIGLIIILKQIPHALGYNADFEGNLFFDHPAPASENTFSGIVHALNFITPGAILITLICLGILILWDTVLMKKNKIFMLIQGPLVAVFAGILLNIFFQAGWLPLSLAKEQLVALPVARSVPDFIAQFSVPDFSHILNPRVWLTAVILAVIASLETLLCVEATDKLDPFKRVTPTNRELKAQGLGNTISGLIGGLPVTQVIVRSSANIAFGARSKLSAILHGVLLLLCVIMIPEILNMIPLATLAAILFIVGYKLAKPSLFKNMYQLGWSQFVPFMATVLGILFTDLLTGIAIGMAVAIFYLLRANYKNPYFFHKEQYTEGELIKLRLSEEVSFLNKASIMQTLNHIPNGAKVLIDATHSKHIDHDVTEVINDFFLNAKAKDITVEIQGEILIACFPHLSKGEETVAEVKGISELQKQYTK
ncbi:MAG: solute carrier family 23 protein [Bacteroidia bacterium]